jgi:hypothetical protein
MCLWKPDKRFQETGRHIAMKGERPTLHQRTKSKITNTVVNAIFEEMEELLALTWQSSLFRICRLAKNQCFELTEQSSWTAKIIVSSVGKSSPKYVRKIRYTYTNIHHANFETYDLRCYNESYHLPAIKYYFSCVDLHFFNY